MMKTILAILALCYTLSASGGELSNPVLDHLNQMNVSYIAYMEDGVLVVHIISGVIDHINVAKLANSVDLEVNLVDYEHVLVEK